MSGEERAAIRARADAATPGPWTYSGCTLWSGVTAEQITEGDRLAEAGDEVAAEALMESAEILFHGDPERDEDAEFIAHARTDVPALLDALAVAERQRDDAHATIRAFLRAAEPITEAADMTGWTREPHLLMVDAKGYIWRHYPDEAYVSMAPTNPDNSPIPQPVTWYEAVMRTAKAPTHLERAVLREAATQSAELTCRADPRPPTSTPTAETVPPRVAGTGGPQNPAQSADGIDCWPGFGR